MLLRGSEGNELELSIAGYQFPDEDRDPWDSNSLLVSVRVLAPEGSWSVVDPCLTTWETRHLVSWLVLAATREAWAPAMIFTEPNLTVVAGAVAGDPNAVQVQARFALELRPPWAHTAAGSDNLVVDLELRRGDLARAAASLLSELAEFPQRGDDPTL